MRCTLPFPSICANLKGEGGGSGTPLPPTDPLWIFIFKLMHVTKISLGIPPGQKKTPLYPVVKLSEKGEGYKYFYHRVSRRRHAATKFTLFHLTCRIERPMKSVRSKLILWIDLTVKRKLTSAFVKVYNFQSARWIYTCTWMGPTKSIDPVSDLMEILQVEAGVYWTALHFLT